MKQINVNNFSSYIRSRLSEFKFKSDMMAFLIDMWHKYKYGEFLLKDVVYNYNHNFYLSSNVEDDRIVAYTIEAYDIFDNIKKIKLISLKAGLVEQFLCDKKPKNQEEAYKIFIDNLSLLLLMGPSYNNAEQR